MNTESTTGLTTDRLKQAAFDLACNQGLASLSARTLALRIGGSASAINYHFGNRENLLVALYDEVTLRMTTAREQAETRALEIVPDWADWPCIFTVVLQMRMDSTWAEIVLMHELEHEIVAGREPQLRSIALAEAHREYEFWIKLAGRFDILESEARVWGDFALGLIGLMLGERESTVRAAWMSAPAVRLHQRIERNNVALVDRRKPASATYAADSEKRATGSARAANTAQIILDATLTTIAKHGADRLTQREVAALAGLSLASVTYFFRTKNDLIYAAFEELRRRVQEQVDVLETLGTQSFTATTTLVQFDDDLQMLSAQQALVRAAARDMALVPIAREIRQLRGIGSFVMLSKRGLVIDWVDAYVWGVIVTGSLRQCLLARPEDPREAIEEKAGGALQMVFGTKDDTSLQIHKT